MATLRCLNYKKKFSGSFGKKYLLILTEKHEKKRSNGDHRTLADRVRSCKINTEREKLESETGVIYSAFLELLYYAAIRMVLIDPMHNLFFGKEDFKIFEF